MNHLFFSCPIARVIWGCIAKCFGANNIPTDLDECWVWLDKWFPQGKKLHVWGVAALYWAIWKARNRACFDKKLIKNPVEVICHAGALMKLWAGLFPEMDRQQIEEGVNTMLKVTMDILASKRCKTSSAVEQDLDDEGASEE